MSSSKKATVEMSPERDYRRELEFLYARRSAIDSLIASLEEYRAHVHVAAPLEERKSA